MRLGTLQSLITIGIVAVITVLTRALPFIVFPKGKTQPKFVRYLGTVLPSGIIALLVVYCFKSIDFFHSPFGVCEIVAAAVVVVCHKIWHNSLLSIGAGTVIYMFLVQAVFAQ